MEVTEDWSAIRIPLAKDYQDNYVTGTPITFHKFMMAGRVSAGVTCISSLC
jgi:hypothetical protein